MATNSAIEQCATCPLCKFTRNSKKDGFFYKFARRIQGVCPNCAEANKASGKDMQKSTQF